MKNQSAKRIAQLCSQFPVLYQIRSQHEFDMDGDSLNARVRIVVQRPDIELLYSDGMCGDHMFTDKPFKGVYNHYRYDSLYAVAVKGLEHKQIASIGFTQRDKRTVNDIFSVCDPHDVEYLVKASIRSWFKPDQEDGGQNEELVGIEVIYTIYPRPVNSSWQELIDESIRVKLERENAYMHPPKEEPNLDGLHEALSKRARIHAFLSGGGLRVVRVNSKTDLIGYGESIHIEEAFVHANEDYLAGGRDYHEVYGKLYPHYLTGDTMSTSNVDNWIRRGHTLDLWFKKGQVVCQLAGLQHQEIPEWVEKSAEENPETPIQWESRGFTYETTYVIGLFPGTGENGFSTHVVNPDESKKDAWFYRMTKTGYGKTIWEAMQNALSAEIEEVPGK